LLLALASEKLSRRSGKREKEALSANNHKSSIMEEHCGIPFAN